MELKSLKRDVSRLENGDWVDGLPKLGDVKLKVRGIGNSKFRRLQDELLRSKSTIKRQDFDERERVNIQLLLDTVLVDWSGITDGGEVVPYSREVAEALMSDEDRSFYDAVWWAGTVVAEEEARTVEADAKN